MEDVRLFFAHEDDYADLNEASCVEHLSDIIQFKTVDKSATGETDLEEFSALRLYLQHTYPTLFGAAQVELVERSLLITVPGKNPELRPLMLMAHMDVVPVVAGTEDDWTHEAFSGHVDPTYIWGRGALDMKDTLVGIMEAAEYVLSHGAQLERGIILALGQDEETLQNGARTLGALLDERGIRPEFVVDEGECTIVDATPMGASDTHIMPVCIAEKGYADIILRVKSAGGHSSNPFGGSSLAILAEAIDRIVQADWGSYLTEPVVGFLEALAPHMDADAPLGMLLSGGREGIEAAEKQIVELALQDRALFPYVTNTVAPTMIEGGSQANNVLPQDMWANINFRMLEGLSCEQIRARCVELLSGLPVEVALEPASNDPSNISRTDGLGYESLVKVAERYFVDPLSDRPVVLVPSMVVGATDCRMYERVCDQCLRFSPFVTTVEDAERGVHGTDERITRRAYMQGIRFMIRLIEEVCAA